MIKSRLRLAIFLLFAVAAGACVDLSPLSHWTKVAPGLDYLHVRDTTESNRPWSVHIARLDRARADLEVISTHAKNQVAALDTVVAQVAAVPPGDGEPLAAINGDFFVIAKGPYQGDPLGLQILSGDLISAPAGASFWIGPGGEYHVGEVRSQLSVARPGGEKFRMGLNEERKTNGLVLFTPAFGPSTRTTNGLEFVLEKKGGGDWLPLRVDQAYAARVREVRTDGDSPLSRDTVVLSVSPRFAAQFSGVRPGEEWQLSTGTTPDVSGARDAIGGRPILLEHGNVESWPVVMGTNGPVRHPRTIIGWNERYFYFVVVDGRQKELSMGMTYEEMADFMKRRLGCTDALNLDGGGSTTFWLKGKVMNSPSDKHERSVANTLIIVQRKPGTPKQ